MAKQLKYPIRRTARFSEDNDAWLVKEADRLGVAPAVAIRIIVEQAQEQENADN